MSLKRFISDVWKTVVKTFESITGIARERLPIAIELVDNIMKYEDDGTIDVITKLIPGTADDKVNAAIRKFLPGLFRDLHLANNCAQLTDNNEILKCGIKTLKESSEWARQILTHGIAAKFTEVFSDGEVTWKDAIGIAEWIFQKLFKKK